MTFDHTDTPRSRDDIYAELQALVASIDAQPQAPAPEPVPPAPEPEPANGGGDVPTPKRDYKPELPAFLVSALCVIAVAVLTFHGDTVPDILNVALMAALTGGAAITKPSGSK